MELVKVTPRNLGEWKQALSAVETFIPEAVLHFTSKGMEIRAIDPSQVVFVELNAPKSVFSEYEVSAPDVPVPVNLSELVKVLSRIGSEYRATFSVEDVNMRISASTAAGKVVREFILPLVDVSEQIPPVTGVQGVRVRVLGRILRDAIKDVGLFASSVLFQVSGDTLMLEGKGSSGSSKVLLGEGQSVRIEGSEAASRYSLPYLSNIARFLPPEGEVELVFSTDSPLRVVFNIGDITLSYLLAHMIL